MLLGTESWREEKKVRWFPREYCEKKEVRRLEGFKT